MRAVLMRPISGCGCARHPLFDKLLVNTREMRSHRHAGKLVITPVLSVQRKLSSCPKAQLMRLFTPTDLYGTDQQVPQSACARVAILGPKKNPQSPIHATWFPQELCLPPAGLYIDVGDQYVYNAEERSMDPVHGLGWLLDGLKQVCRPPMSKSRKVRLMTYWQMAKRVEDEQVESFYSSEMPAVLQVLQRYRSLQSALCRYTATKQFVMNALDREELTDSEKAAISTYLHKWAEAEGVPVGLRYTESGEVGGMVLHVEG